MRPAPSISALITEIDQRWACDLVASSQSLSQFRPPPPSTSPTGGRGCLMFSSCLESQGCRLIPLSYLLSCLFFLPSPLDLSVLSFFLLMVHSPDLFFQENSQIYCMALAEYLGDDSWLVDAGICYYAYISFFIYIILCLSIPFSYFSLTWYR